VQNGTQQLTVRESCSSAPGTVVQPNEIIIKISNIA